MVGVGPPYLCAMRVLTSLVGAGLALSTSVLAQAPATTPAVPPPSGQARPTHAAAKPGVRPANAAKPIGKFDDWTAATHSEAGQSVCYAFTRVQASTPAVPGRGDVVLTVTQRPSGRDAVAMSAGFPIVASVDAVMTVDKADLAFYTNGRSAFARDGHTVVTAFEKARTASMRSPGPRNTPVVDAFSLRGFGAAYAAINKACPAK